MLRYLRGLGNCRQLLRGLTCQLSDSCSLASVNRWFRVSGGVQTNANKSVQGRLSECGREGSRASLHQLKCCEMTELAPMMFADLVGTGGTQSFFG